MLPSSFISRPNLMMAQLNCIDLALIAWELTIFTLISHWCLPEHFWSATSIALASHPMYPIFIRTHRPSLIRP